MSTTRHPSIYEDLRGSILANMPLSVVARSLVSNGEASLWDHFVAADNLAVSDPVGAREHLLTVVKSPDVESRACLQAWHCLRELGTQPDDHTRSQILGMVVEVGLAGGLDSVCGYRDRTARYFNHSGAAVFWDAESADMNAQIEGLLSAATVVAQHTAPLGGAHPHSPQAGMMLINVLTPGGIHYGMGPTDALQGDPMGAAVTSSAIALMTALMQAQGS